MWEKAFSKEKPLSNEPVGGGRYLIRRNVKKVTDEGEESFYAYEECLVDGNVYALLMEKDEKIEELQLAVIELAELLEQEG